MNRVQFFYDDELILLQDKINSWLKENEYIEILSTDLSSLGKLSTRAGIVRTEKYVFFILYRTKEDKLAMAAAASLSDVATPDVTT